MKVKIILIFFVCLKLISCATSPKRVANPQEKDPRYQYNLGLTYMNSSQLDLAIKHLKQSLSLEPNNHLALNALGLTYTMKGNFEESVKYLTECLKINPTLTEAQNNLGVAYQELKLFDKAEELFILASLDTQYISRENPFYNLARLYFTQNKFQDALFQVQKSLEIKHDFFFALFHEGLIFSKLDQLDNAIRSFETALEINPNDVDLNFNLAEAYFNNRQFEKAKQIFTPLYLQSSDVEMKKKIESYLRIIK